MPPDLHNDQELVLKKRARRRLVGAIALVLLMVIILPRILQDRAALAPKETVKISMPAVNLAEPSEPVIRAESIEAKVDNITSNAVDLTVSSEMVIPEAPVVREAQEVTKVESNILDNNAGKLNAVKNSQENVKSAQKTETKSVDTKIIAANVSDAKSAKVSLVEAKVKVSKSPEIKAHEGTFSIQIGVFSDITNVKPLQEKLKKAGLDSRTETISTDKGEKTRLKAGHFASRQEAVTALNKLQSANLSGMVMGND